MRYRRLEGSDSGGTVPLDLAFDPRQAASVKAMALRERAHRYRELAETFYDLGVVAEVEALANELEEEAIQLEMASFPFFRAA